MPTKNLTIAVLLLVLSIAVQAQSLSNHYQLTVDVDPVQGLIKSHCNLRLVADKETKEIIYWMNPAFQSIKVTGQNVDSVWFTDSSPSLSFKFIEIHIRFDSTLAKGKATDINFNYQGVLNADQFIDRGNITPIWTELSIDALWYPLSLEEILLTYEIAVTAPRKYTVESAGQVVQLEETKWAVREENETPGRITLILSNKLHQISTTFGPYTVDFFVLDTADSLIDSLQLFSRMALKLFEEKFGVVKSGNKRLKIFFPNLDMEGVSDGGYSSNGSFVMLANQREANIQFLTLSHEIAHFWWTYGTYGTYHDFLNEGLAEFSMLLAFREKYGTENLASRIKYYREETKGLGSIRSWTYENSQERQHYMYWKGSLVILDLLDQVGDEKLFAILRRTAAEKVSRYEGFLQIIKETTDEQTAKEFDRTF